MEVFKRKNDKEKRKGVKVGLLRRIFSSFFFSLEGGEALAERVDECRRQQHSKIDNFRTRI